MAVDNLEIIDIVSINMDGHAVLTISDELKWDENEHLLTLQNKINAYLSAIEGGSLYVHYPNAIGKDIVINIVAKYEPTAEATAFLKKMGKILKAAGYGFTFSVLK
jgi:hypothetical protein